jgi:hypothetical protein
MNRHTFCGACFCLAAAWVVGGGSIAFGQVIMNLQVNGAMLRQAAGPVFVPAEVDGVAIGDPWWDDAAPPPKAGDPDAAPAAAAGDDQADGADPRAQMEAQLRAQAEMVRMSARQQGLAILRRELSIVRQTCPSLERQQRALVVEAGRAAVENAVEDQMTAALGRRRGRPADLEAAIGEALRKSVAANAADSESVAYEAERGLRKERAKQATIAALVADVDRDAFLDEAERQALAKTLAESYHERWRGALSALQSGMPVLGATAPQGLDRSVEKALGKDRKAEWLARREAAGQLVAQAVGQQIQVLGDHGMVQIQAQAFGGGGAVRRVIRRRVGGDGNGFQMQLEVQVGGGGEADREVDVVVEQEK